MGPCVFARGHQVRQLKASGDVVLPPTVRYFTDKVMVPGNTTTKLQSKTMVTHAAKSGQVRYHAVKWGEAARMP